jgi:hypothetical protein
VGELGAEGAEASEGEVGAASAVETGTPPAPKLIETALQPRAAGEACHKRSGSRSPCDANSKMRNGHSFADD